MKETTTFSPKELHELFYQAKFIREPMGIIDLFPTLRIKEGYTLGCSPHGIFEGGVGNVWAVPVDYEFPDIEQWEKVDLYDLPHPLPTNRCCWDGLTMEGDFKLPVPPGALDSVMEIIEGDGTPLSYLRASIFAREIAEFGSHWHGEIWKVHTVLGDDLDDLEPITNEYHDERGAMRIESFLKWYEDKQILLAPVVIQDDETITVRFYTYSMLCRESVYCYTDTYKIGNYKFDWNIEIIWEGNSRMLF